MGKLRSRDGCLTCRRRHIKCDEAKPVCSQCARADRDCVQGGRSRELQVKRYRPRQDRSSSIGENGSRTPTASERGSDWHSTSPAFHLDPRRPSRPNEDVLFQGPFSPEHGVLLSSATPPPLPGASPPDPPLTTASTGISPASLPSTRLLHHDANAYPGSASSPLSVVGDVDLSRRDALLVHHFAEHLGRWLDCTDASRQFTLKITAMAKISPIVLHSVKSFAARHIGDTAAADQAQQQCIELLIPLLSSDTVAEDEGILCAIVILRVCEQLSATVTGSDQERHLAGFTALLKTSQGRQVDPSIPTLSQAAFWVYVRQCLYNACVNQQPPNVDFDLAMLPPPPADGLTIDVKTETAWANTMTWICATVVHFCFGSNTTLIDPLNRMRKWEELVTSVEAWDKTKPMTFNPLWDSGASSSESSPFPQILFTADWHVMAFGFYHLASMLLVIYKPAPKFAIRSIRRTLPETDEAVLTHAHALCGVCKSSPSTVPSLITLCHSVFIWAPLMTEAAEQHCVIDMLQDLEEKHAWPTNWIISALREEWMI